MKFKSIVLIFIFALLTNNTLFANDTSSTSMNLTIDQKKEDIIKHTVSKGETVYSIATIYNITAQDIYRLNPDAQKGIREGGTLRIIKVRVPERYSNHVIEAKETLYSVSKMYDINVEELKRANTGLDENSFSIGKSIRIPLFYSEVNAPKKPSEHKVAKGETLYTIGKTYSVSVDILLKSNPALSGGLKEGMLLTIPQDNDQSAYNRTISEIATTSASQPNKIVKVGILFPFLEDKGNIQKDKLIEYYEGFLLAVKELKEKGLNAEIYTFNIGSEKDTERLESILGTSELNGLSLLIGGVSKPQIDILTRFSQKTGIRYLVPFESRNTNVEFSPSVFQMTTSHTNRYNDIITAFIRKFGKSNIVFVSERGSNNDKNDFISELKRELTKWNIAFKTTKATESLSSDIKQHLSASEKNVLVPTSSSEATLRRTTAALKTMDKNADLTLFGYPEWQTYTQSRADLHQFNTHIYSIFFVDEQQREVINFNNEYKKWYNANLINSFPKYGMLGYDAGLFFLTALEKYDTGLEINIPNLKVQTLQSAIHFERINSKGGFINNGIYFVRYTPSKTIEKIDISR